MKINYILSVAVIAAALGSCTRIDESRLTGPSGNGGNSTADGGIISLKASVPSLGATKSSSLIWDYNGLIESNDSLSLYAYANFNGDSTIVDILDNVPMWYDATSCFWTYTPIQHWIPSADRYGFYATYPFAQGRLTPGFKFPEETEHYVLSLQPTVYPMYETWGGEDYAKGNIIHKLTRDLYLSNPTPDLMFGGSQVEPSSFGSTVNLPLSHAACAVRFSVRNLSETPFTLTNWYMTGLKNHVDMCIYIIDCAEEYEPLRFMTILQNKEIDSLHISNFGGDEQDLLYLADAKGTPTICADGGVKPGQDGYYEYVLLSSPLKEVGATYNMSHSHNLDGTITYNINGTKYTDREAMMNDSYYKEKLKVVEALYKPEYYGNYTKSIFWGPAHGLCTDHFFMPLAYKRGAQIIDLDRDQIRGDVDDYNLLIHQFECRSYVMQPKGTTDYKSNGGIYMPVSGDNLAHLYSPYFLNAAKFSSVTGDWKEAMDPLTADASVFRCTIDSTEANFIKPVPVDSCVARMNRNKGKEDHTQYTPSVQGGDLANVLNDWGYLLMYPQDLDHLVFNFHTSAASSASISGIEVDATYNESTSNILHSFSPKNYTPGGEWLSGYKYDYIITVSSSSISVQLDVEPWNEREILLD